MVESVATKSRTERQQRISLLVSEKETPLCFCCLCHFLDNRLINRQQNDDNGGEKEFRERNAAECFSFCGIERILVVSLLEGMRVRVRMELQSGPDDYDKSHELPHPSIALE